MKLNLDINTIQAIIDRLRQPEYIGDNRCTPCTIVNLVIACVASRLIARRSQLAGVGSFGIFTGAIYLRGYLVPGTPTLTKQYLPSSFLRLFNKQPIGGRMIDSTEIEVEPILHRAHAIEPCGEDEYCLTTSFRTAWLDHAESLRTHEFDLSHIAEVMDQPEEQLMITEHELGTLLVLATETSEDDDIIAQWESDAAILADVAAGYTLRERSPDWSKLTPNQRCYLLRGLRAFVDTCPVCGESVSASEDTVESCCGMTEVRAIHCQQCDTRLLEVPV